MEHAILTPAVAADAGAVTEVVVALESSLYGQSAFSQADLEEEWSEVDLERDARVVRDGDRVVGYGWCASAGRYGVSRDTSTPTRSGAGSGR